MTSDTSVCQQELGSTGPKGVPKSQVVEANRGSGIAPGGKGGACDDFVDASGTLFGRFDMPRTNWEVASHETPSSGLISCCVRSTASQSVTRIASNINTTNGWIANVPRCEIHQWWSMWAVSSRMSYYMSLLCHYYVILCYYYVIIICYHHVSLLYVTIMFL